MGPRAWALEAPGEGASPLVKAKGALDELRLDDAVALAAPLTASPDEPTRMRALALCAEAHLLAGRLAEGEAEVRQLYALAPGFALDDPSLPPRVTRVFEAEGAKPHPRAATLRARPDAGDAGAFALVARGVSPDRVSLACRPSAAAPYAPVATTARDGAHRFELPTLAAHACYAIALDAAGVPLGSLGSAREPFSLSPHAVAPPRPAGEPHADLTSRWWFWAAIGGVVIGAAATTAVVVASRSRGSTTPPPADLTVQAKGALVSW
jgi:hypothetical protein